MRTHAPESMEENRRLTFLRVKRLFEYDFLPEDELFQDPLKGKEFLEIIGMYDWSVSMKYQLDVQVDQ